MIVQTIVATGVIVAVILFSIARKKQYMRAKENAIPLGALNRALQKAYGEAAPELINVETREETRWEKVYRLAVDGYIMSYQIRKTPRTELDRMPLNSADAAAVPVELVCVFQELQSPDGPLGLPLWFLRFRDTRLEEATFYSGTDFCSRALKHPSQEETHAADNIRTLALSFI